MDRSLKYLAVFGLLYIVLVLCFLRNYLSLASLNMQLGMAALLFSARVDRSGAGNSRYGMAAVLSLVLLYYVPAKACMYLSIVLALVFAIESFAGKLNVLPLFVLMLMSPVFDFMANIFSFPIRLSVTALASRIMSYSGAPVTAEGNLIILNGDEFSVDPACMGLSMFTASLLASCMFIAGWQRKLSLRLPMLFVLANLLVIVVFNLLSNLVRIIVLVNFKVLPETVMHDVVGLCCFFLYQLLPAACLSRLLVKRFGKPVGLVNAQGEPRRRLVANVAVALLTVAVLMIAGRNTRKELIPGTNVALPGYKCESVSGDVLKLSNDKVLIYIKPIPAFYSGEHHPMICWKGSGYQFREVSERKHTNGSVYQGRLEKGKEVLYTAWWYDNGALSTTSQFEWRLNAMCTKKDFSLVNITAATPAELERQVAAFRQIRIMQHLLAMQDSNR